MLLKRDIEVDISIRHSAEVKAILD